MSVINGGTALNPWRSGGSLSGSAGCDVAVHPYQLLKEGETNV